jgi:hypothetical protein
VDVLSRLVEKSLVVAESLGAETRYRLLETIRQYAQDKLLESGEVEQARSRHLHYYLHVADAADPQLRSADQLEWLARLEAEHDNLRAALKWAVASEDAESGLRLAGGLARFWYLRGYWREGREWLAHMLAHARLEGHAPDGAATRSFIQARIRALCGAGWLADEDGSEGPLYSEALALSRANDDRWSEAFALRGQVAGAANLVNPDQVSAQLQRSLALFEALGDSWGRGLAEYNLGWVALDGNGDVARAKASWERALEHFRQTGDRWGIAVTLNALGYVARTHGNYPRATELANDSLDLFRQLGDKAGIGMSLNRLASVALRRGDFTEAASLLQESLAVQHELGDPMGVIDVLDLWGLVLAYQGHYAEAEAMLRDGLARAREIDARRDIPYFLRYLGFVAYCQRDFAEAEVLWRECIALHRVAADGEVPARYAERGLGLVALRRGDIAQAARQIQAAWRDMPPEADRRTKAMALRDMAEVALAKGDRLRARADLHDALQMNTKIGDKLGLARTLEGTARAVDDAPLAVRLLGVAQTVRKAIGAPRSPVEQDDADRCAEALRATLGAAAFDAAWAEGEALSPESAVTIALVALEARD